MFIILKLYIQIDNIDDYKQNINIKQPDQTRSHHNFAFLPVLWNITLLLQ